LWHRWAPKSGYVWLCQCWWFLALNSPNPPRIFMGDSDLNPRPWTSDRSQSQWGNVCLDFDPWLHFSSGQALKGQYCRDRIWNILGQDKYIMIYLYWISR
jgi:hypothetical protein